MSAQESSARYVPSCPISSSVFLPPVAKEAAMPSRRPTAGPATVDVQVHGPVPEDAVPYASDKVRHVIEYANQPVLAARVVLTMAPDPAIERPARAETSLDVSGTQVRAHAIAS